MAINAERLVKVISSTLHREVTLEQVQGVNLIETLGLSSIDALEILVGVEGEFGIEIQDEDLSINLISSFAALQDYVQTRLAAKPGNVATGVGN